MIYIIKLFSRLPFGVLYALSDFIYILVYYVVGYRKKIVRKNLRSSFPEKEEEELHRIEKDFYHWFCDYFVETLKMLTMDSEEMKKHMVINGCEKIVEIAETTGQEVSTFLGHYCNWEWMSAIKLYWPERERETVFGLIYHKLSNKTFDRLMIETRSQYGGTCIQKKNILRELLRCSKENLHHMFGYIFDQGPKWENIHLWLDFMNHDTPVFTGAERIVRKKNDIVTFTHIERVCRGKYVANMEIVSARPAEEDEYAITKKCFELLEKDIRKTPYLYLWTHDRWKRTREGYEKWLNEKNK